MLIFMFTVMFTVKPVKTTIDLRDDLHAIIVQTFGARGISRAINDLLSENLLPKEDGFGKFKCMAKADIRKVRDEDDRDI